MRFGKKNINDANCLYFIVGVVDRNIFFLKQQIGNIPFSNKRPSLINNVFKIYVCV